MAELEKRPNLKVDPEAPLVVTHVNGSTINQEKRGAFICIDNLGDGYNAEFLCTLEQGDRLEGLFIDGVPHGILNKTITGIGATTLEMKSPRNSIIVMPTKALAYNKHTWAERELGENSSIYVGSAIDNIRTDIQIDDIQAYLNLDDSRNKKILVVADSLYKVIRAIGENVYQEYFFMVDEVDALQSDSPYRPNLEKVIDYYFLFNRKKRVVVTATLNEFSDKRFENESKVTTIWQETPRRNIDLVHTNNVDAVAISKIKNITQSNSNEKILIAYNSLDGILNIINLLGEEYKRDCGILCSERSHEKASDYIENVIDENGSLQKRVTFLTCSYFAGIDIMDRCHVISVSTNNQPFTLLSPNRLTQIAGRCRNGRLSETIIFDTKELESQENYDTYKNKLMEQAVFYADFLSTGYKAAQVNPVLRPIGEEIKSIAIHSAVSKVANNYSIPLTRVNMEHEPSVAYFNIDALLEKWRLHYSLYNKKEALLEALNKHNNVAYSEKYEQFGESQIESIAQIKQDNKEMLQQSLQDAKVMLLEWKQGGGSPVFLNQLTKTSDKQLKEFYTRFKQLSPYLDTEFLIDKLIENFDKRKYRNFHNAVIFHAMEDNHAFKAHTLAQFDYSAQSDRIIVTSADKKQKMSTVLSSQLKMKIHEDTATEYFSSFFKTIRTGGNYKIVGLNPLDLPEPLTRIKDGENLIKLFIFPNE